MVEVAPMPTDVERRKAQEADAVNAPKADVVLEALKGIRDPRTSGSPAIYDYEVDKVPAKISPDGKFTETRYTLTAPLSEAEAKERAGIINRGLRNETSIEGGNVKLRSGETKPFTLEVIPAVDSSGNPILKDGKPQYQVSVTATSLANAETLVHVKDGKAELKAYERAAGTKLPTLEEMEQQKVVARQRKAEEPLRAAEAAVAEAEKKGLDNPENKKAHTHAKSLVQIETHLMKVRAEKLAEGVMSEPAIVQMVAAERGKLTSQLAANEKEAQEKNANREYTLRERQRDGALGELRSDSDYRRMAPATGVMPYGAKTYSGVGADGKERYYVYDNSGVTPIRSCADAEERIKWAQAKTDSKNAPKEGEWKPVQTPNGTWVIEMSESYVNRVGNVDPKLTTLIEPKPLTMPAVPETPGKEALPAGMKRERDGSVTVTLDPSKMGATEAEQRDNAHKLYVEMYKKNDRVSYSVGTETVMENKAGEKVTQAYVDDKGQLVTQRDGKFVNAKGEPVPSEKDGKFILKLAYADETGQFVTRNEYGEYINSKGGQFRTAKPVYVNSKGEVEPDAQPRMVNEKGERVTLRPMAGETEAPDPKNPGKTIKVPNAEYYSYPDPSGKLNPDGTPVRKPAQEYVNAAGEVADMSKVRAQQEVGPDGQPKLTIKFYAPDKGTADLALKESDFKGKAEAAARAEEEAKRRAASDKATAEAREAIKPIAYVQDGARLIPLNRPLGTKADPVAEAEYLANRGGPAYREKDLHPNGGLVAGAKPIDLNPIAMVEKDGKLKPVIRPLNVPENNPAADAAYLKSLGVPVYAVSNVAGGKLKPDAKPMDLTAMATPKAVPVSAPAPAKPTLPEPADFVKAANIDANVKVEKVEGGYRISMANDWARLNPKPEERVERLEKVLEKAGTFGAPNRFGALPGVSWERNPTNFNETTGSLIITAAELSPELKKKLGIDAPAAAPVVAAPAPAPVGAGKVEYYGSPLDPMIAADPTGGLPRPAASPVIPPAAPVAAPPPIIPPASRPTTLPPPIIPPAPRPTTLPPPVIPPAPPGGNAVPSLFPAPAAPVASPPPVVPPVPARPAPAPVVPPATVTPAPAPVVPPAPAPVAPAPAAGIKTIPTPAAPLPPKPEGAPDELAAFATALGATGIEKNANGKYVMTFASEEDRAKADDRYRALVDRPLTFALDETTPTTPPTIQFEDGEPQSSIATMQKRELLALSGANDINVYTPEAPKVGYTELSFRTEEERAHVVAEMEKIFGKEKLAQMTELSEYKVNVGTPGEYTYRGIRIKPENVQEVMQGLQSAGGIPMSPAQQAELAELNKKLGFDLVDTPRGVAVTFPNEEEAKKAKDALDKATGYTGHSGVFFMGVKETTGPDGSVTFTLTDKQLQDLKLRVANQESVPEHNKLVEMTGLPNVGSYAAGNKKEGMLKVGTNNEAEFNHVVAELEKKLGGKLEKFGIKTEVSGSSHTLSFPRNNLEEVTGLVARNGGIEKFDPKNVPGASKPSLAAAPAVEDGKPTPDSPPAAAVKPAPSRVSTELDGPAGAPKPQPKEALPVFKAKPHEKVVADKPETHPHFADKKAAMEYLSSHGFDFRTGNKVDAKGKVVPRTREELELTAEAVGTINAFDKQERDGCKKWSPQYYRLTHSMNEGEKIIKNLNAKMDKMDEKAAVAAGTHVAQPKVFDPLTRSWTTPGGNTVITGGVVLKPEDRSPATAAPAPKNPDQIGTEKPALSASAAALAAAVQDGKALLDSGTGKLIGDRSVAVAVVSKPGMPTQGADPSAGMAM